MAPVWSKQRRSCLTFTVIYGVGALCLLAVLAAISNLLSNQAIPNQCVEYRDASAVAAVDVPVTRPSEDAPRVDEGDLRFDPRILDGFQLWRVAPYNAPSPASAGVVDADTVPILFVHGHRGAPSQAFAMATIANVRTAAEASGGPGALRAFTFYTADFHEGSSAFHAGVLLGQAWFINDAVRAILARHPRARHVPVFAHSMGGISARLAYHLANHPLGAMDTLVTLNTPHQGHPYGVDAAVQRLFDGLHRRWSRPLVEAGWRPVRPRALREAEAASRSGDGSAAPQLAREADVGPTREWWRLRPGEPRPPPDPVPATDAVSRVSDPLRGIVLVSITGGAMDNLVRPDLASLAGVVAPHHGFSASTQTMAGAWIQSVHEGIVNCGQAAAVLVDALFELHPRLLLDAPRGSSGVATGALPRDADVAQALDADVSSRLAILRRHLRDSDAAAAILLSQRRGRPGRVVGGDGGALQDALSGSAAASNASEGLQLHLHASSSVPAVSLMSPSGGGGAEGADARPSPGLSSALWRGPWDRDEHAWAGRTCFDLRAHDTRRDSPDGDGAGGWEREGGGLQLVTDLPGGSFRVTLRRLAVTQPPSVNASGQRPPRQNCAKLTLTDAASFSAALRAASSAASKDAVGGACVDVTGAFATVPDALRRNHLHNSWDRVHRDPPASTAELVLASPAHLAEGAVAALGAAQVRGRW